MSSENGIQELTEADLLQRVAAGDESAFSQFYDRIAPALFQLAFRILQDTALAEDVVQDAFLQIWDKADQYDPKLGRPFSWAISLTRNKAIDRLRAGARRARSAEEAGRDIQARQEDSLDPAFPSLFYESAQAVRAAMADLPPEQRHPIELAYFGGLTQTQIAASLQLPLGTVKARIRRGLLQLRDALKEFV